MMADSSSDLEEDEEEILVYVEFDNCETNDVFSSENLKLDILGLDSEHPVMQVNGKFFEGKYEDAVGTYLFFDNDNNPEINDPVFDKISSIKYFNKTRKLLRMQRAFVVPRYEVVGDSNHPKSIPNMETIKEAGVPPSYQEEALSFWKNSRSTRMDALQKYLKKQQFRKELRQRGFEPDSASDEDNPFAMYKNFDDESESNPQNNKKDYDTQMEKLNNSLQNTELDEEYLTNNSKKLTVIDPGPSTSKGSVPWVDNDDTIVTSSIDKVKSIGRVKTKGRVANGKVTKKRNQKPFKNLVSPEKNSEDKNQTNQSLNDNNIDDPSDDSTGNNVKMTSNSNKKSKPTKKSIFSRNQDQREMEVDEDVEVSNRLLSKALEPIVKKELLVLDKEKRRQERIEAKKKEIRDKLKALGQNTEKLDS